MSDIHYGLLRVNYCTLTTSDNALKCMTNYPYEVQNNSLLMIIGTIKAASLFSNHMQCY